MKSTLFKENWEFVKGVLENNYRREKARRTEILEEKRALVKGHLHLKNLNSVVKISV